MSDGAAIAISAMELRQFATAVLRAAGVPSEEATIVAESLVESNLCGHESHGVVRVVEYLDFLQRGEVACGVDLTIVSQSPGALVCDGQLGFGQVQMQRLIDLLEPMAREQGLAAATMRRCGHTGRLGEWVERLAERGLAALMTVNDNGAITSVAPPGGIEPRISTNPLAIGVPTADRPLVLDLSTSVVANGKIRVAQIAGQQCPDGWLLDAQGQPTNDPSTRFAEPPGTILPMGGYKGFGLGMLLDILVGGLSGGSCPPGPYGVVECNNVLLMAFDPQRFAGLTHFVVQSQGLCDFVRSATPVNDGAAIRLPGDRSQQLHDERSMRGIPLDRGTWGQLAERAQQLGVTIPVV